MTTGPRRNHRNAKVVCGDIRRINIKEFSEVERLNRGCVDIIIGGPPCQGFSSIRPFRSSLSEDPRNALFNQFANFVDFYRPKAVVFENVVGLATHKNGETLEGILECFNKIGYSCDWKIINAASFGVPQKRERLIIIGLDSGAKWEFPNPTHEASGDTIGFRDKRRLLSAGLGELWSPSFDLKPSVTVFDAISDLPHLRSGESIEYYTEAPCNSYQIDRRQGSSILTLHNSTDHSPKMLEIIRFSGKNIKCIPSHLISSGFSSCYSRLSPNEPATTITVNFVHPASNRCIHPTQDRALTPREGARLQSFDDTFQFAGSRTEVVKQIGSAVPPLLGKAIAEQIAKFL